MANTGDGDELCHAAELAEKVLDTSSSNEAPRRSLALGLGREAPLPKSQKSIHAAGSDLPYSQPICI